MIQNLLVKTKFNADLETMSGKLAELLNIDFAELRFSDNVAGGCYFLAKPLGLEIQLMEGDDAAFPDYNFEIVFDAESGGTGDLVGLSDLVARVLARNDMKVVRPLGADLDSGAVEYGE